jgi:hypothetical protein
MYRDKPLAPEPALEPFDSTEPTEYAAPLFDDEDRTSIVHLPWFMIDDEWACFPELEELEDGDDPTAVERPEARVSHMLAERQSRESRGRHDTVRSTPACEESKVRDRRDTVSTASFHEMQTAPAGPTNLRVKEVWEQYDGPDLFDLLANFDPAAEEKAASALPAAAAKPPVDHSAEVSDLIDELIARESAALPPRPDDRTYMIDRLEPRKPSRRGLGLLAALLVLAGLCLAILYFHARQVWDPSLSNRAPDAIVPLAENVEQSPAPASFLSGLGGAGAGFSAGNNQATTLRF